ncbi:MAG: hypothetical protein ACK5ZJ_14285, partial [Acidobacteriota bacterium]
QWKGVTYSPRRHTYFRMLYDWNNWDPIAGKPVYQMVDEDLQMLSTNGFNLVHLYLWDRNLLLSVNNQEPAGFCDYPSAPNTCSPQAQSQWAALADFVQRAENRGIFVALHFASGKLLTDIQNNQPPSVAGQNFALWAKQFIDYLTPTRMNVLLWGLNFALDPAPGDPTNGYSQTWGHAYKWVDTYARQRYSSHPQLGIVGANVTLEFTSVPQPVAARNGGYQWDWQKSQRIVKTMRDVLTQHYGYAKDPDIYMVQVYHPNSGDVQNSLNQLIQSPYNPSIALNIPVNKFFAVEFATSSSLKEAWQGYDQVRANEVQSYGDSNTPTTTPSGQYWWVNNALCAYTGVNVQKFAYWSLYDPYTMWSGWPWYKYGSDLAWNAYWGLAYERESDGLKSSFSLVSNFYKWGSSSLYCPAPGSRIPTATAQTDSYYYTIWQPVGVRWTTSEAASLSITNTSPSAASYACDTGATVSPSGLTGSCALAYANGNTSTGNTSYTVTSTNSGGQSWYATTPSVTIGSAPLVSVVTDSTYSYTINQYDTVIVWGQGLSKFNTSYLRWSRPGYGDVWMWAYDGYYYWNYSYNQINASLGGRLAPGQWTLNVYNGYSGSPSSSYSVYVNY